MGARCSPCHLNFPIALFTDTDMLSFPDRYLCRSLWQLAGHWSAPSATAAGPQSHPKPIVPEGGGQRTVPSVILWCCHIGTAIQWPQGTASSAISSLPVLSQLQLPWPDALCHMALNTSVKICNAKSTNGHVSNVPMQSQRMASVQCPSSIQNQPMVSVECANAMQSQPMATALSNVPM